jgi:hypothetical protein
MKYTICLLTILSLAYLKMGVAMILKCKSEEKDGSYDINFKKERIYFLDQVEAQYLIETYPYLLDYFKVDKATSPPLFYIPADTVQRLVFEMVISDNFAFLVHVTFVFNTDYVSYYLLSILFIQYSLQKNMKRIT